MRDLKGEQRVCEGGKTSWSTQTELVLFSLSPDATFFGQKRVNGRPEPLNRIGQGQAWRDDD